MMHAFKRVFVSAVSLMLAAAAFAQDFTTFESQQFRPLAMSPDGNQLFVVNTPDNRLEIFDISATGLAYIASVNVGLEPVAVAARTNSEVWVVNHLSDSVSIVDLSGAEPRVIRTLLVGDEPRDIVFAGAGNVRAFISAAHRGQNSPYMDPDNVSEATTPGIGRADVWVFNALALGNALGGAPIEILTLFGDSPGALTVSPDGETVYASVFKSGNQTTTISEGSVCDGFTNASSPCVAGPDELTSAGGLPWPNEDSDSVLQPETGLIVKYDGAAWRDELGRNWSNQVRFNLPDLDVFAIDATATTPAELQAFPSVGTVLFGLVVNPASGNLYVSNTEAINEVRFLGPRSAGSGVTTTQGRIAESRITVIDPSVGSVVPRHLNKHIDYSVSPAPAAVRDASLAMPTGLAISADGTTLYVAANGSAKIGVFDTAELENDSFTPDPVNHIQLSGGGPTGLLLDETRERLYVFTRFDNTVSIIDTETSAEGQRVALFNPEPESVVEGRPYLYDAFYTSSNGEASCASCHIAGDKDELAWDLGNPFGSVQTNTNPFKGTPDGNTDFHPIKGPMLTQTLRGIDTHGPLHFRGDQVNPADPMDEVAAFMTINPAFVALLGRDAQLTTEEMSELSEFVMQLTPPPNPNRNLDFSLTAAQARGAAAYFSDPMACFHCHSVNPAVGFFGASGKSAELGTQAYKISHLRNVYERIGMFGRPDTADVLSRDSEEHEHMGDQIRGYGFLHDGSHDTLFRYNRLTNLVFNNPTLNATENEKDQIRRDVEQFQLVFYSNLLPVVGQQVTLTSTSTPAIHARADLLIARAEAGNAELVVKGTVAGESRGWHYDSTINLFKSDRSAESALSDSALRAKATLAGQELTYTAVPIGSGLRIGIDRDRDSELDGDDNCPAIPNPLQTDTDNDSLGDECDPDSDGDGMPDEWEIQYGLNPLDPSDASLDGDNDNLTNVEEFGYLTDPTDKDSDNDWIRDDYEVNFLLTNPNSPDTDGDGMPDFWEGINWLGPTDPTNATRDTDHDGFTDLEEYQNGTNPRRFDAGANAAPDVNAGTDQSAVLPASVQLAGFVTDDGLPGASVSLAWSVLSGPGGATISNVSILDPVVSFVLPGTYVLRLTANDSQTSSADDVQITISAGSDSDGDGMPDTWETTYGLNPYDAADASGDADADGLNNADEFSWTSNPLNRDSDFDWINDGYEVNTIGTSPVNRDTDGDTMPDRWEATYGVGPTDPASGGYDPDGDGYTNLQEYQNGTNPIVAN